MVIKAYAPVEDVKEEEMRNSMKSWRKSAKKEIRRMQ